MARIQPWNGPLFEIWLKYRDLTAEGLRAHSESAISIAPPATGDRVLDIGCGLGDTTIRLAELVGEGGSAHGVATRSAKVSRWPSGSCTANSRMP